MPWGGWGARPPRVSLSARRAWIEIATVNTVIFCIMVALRKESVDRNQGVHYDNYNLHCVALRKESVDRNLWWGVRKAVGSLVALRKESVDRNCELPSKAGEFLVALRKESVDRNIPPIPTSQTSSRSLSARRAWIEIASCRRVSGRTLSLSARRAWIEISVTRYKPTPKPGRSPQGERG